MDDSIEEDSDEVLDSEEVMDSSIGSSDTTDLDIMDSGAKNFEMDLALKETIDSNGLIILVGIENSSTSMAIPNAFWSLENIQSELDRQSKLEASK